MNKRCGLWWLSAAVVGAGLALNSGCQTYVVETGQTLPTPDYLHHLPQFIPPTPQYPLPKEESNLEQAVARQNPQ